MPISFSKHAYAFHLGWLCFFGGWACFFDGWACFSFPEISLQYIKNQTVLIVIFSLIIL